MQPYDRNQPYTHSHCSHHPMWNTIRTYFENW